MNWLNARRWEREKNIYVQLAFAPICPQVVKEKQTWKINSFHFQLLLKLILIISPVSL